MKVLMLGWEFPPHISGGLGTACFGLTQGLSQHGVDVLFVVPRAQGDEDARFVKIFGANEVVIEDEVQLPPRRVVKERVEEGVEVVETTIIVPRAERAAGGIVAREDEITGSGDVAAPRSVVLDVLQTETIVGETDERFEYE